MEKLLIILAEICSALLSILCVYHYFAHDNRGIIILFSLVFAGMAVWLHKIQRPLHFDFKVW